MSDATVSQPEANSNRPIVTRENAIERGLKRYFTGVPCKHGHVSERRASTRSCIECQRLDQVARYASDLEVSRERARNRYAENPERYRESVKKWAKANPEKAKAMRSEWLQSSREHCREYGARWRSENPSQMRALRQNARARTEGVCGVCSGADIDRMLIEQGGQCNACTAPFDAVEYTVDHVIPLKKGGGNHPANLQLLCSWCNRSKKNSDFNAWLEAKRSVLNKKRAHWAEWRATQDAAF